MTARTEQMEAKYQKAKKDGTLVPLHLEKKLKEWEYWILIDNRFPHDKLNTRHHMVVLKRDCQDIWAITEPELAELYYKILKWADARYHYAKLNFAKLRSVNGILHIHLCDHKEEYI